MSEGGVNPRTKICIGNEITFYEEFNVDSVLSILTSSLILWFIYLGYILIRSLAVEEGQGARFATPWVETRLFVYSMLRYPGLRGRGFRARLEPS